VTTIRDRQGETYRRAREALLREEIKLKEQIEHVAELRRSLPESTSITTDYVFDEGPTDLTRNSDDAFFRTKLSSLFSGEQDALIIQHLMFGPNAEKGCPMCSMWADGFNGVAHHIADRVGFAVVARAPIERLRRWGHARGWRRLRLLSSATNSFNPDFGVQITDDRQLPALSVFTRDEGGRIRHSYTSEDSLQERHHRALDLYSPVWNLFDLLPNGRGDWMPDHFYHD
jgi:predicted dithiol-disulfide oxidoreductase (DUF899 family)